MTASKNLIGEKSPRYEVSVGGPHNIVKATSSGVGIFRGASIHGPIYIDGEFGDHIVHPIDDSKIIGVNTDTWIDYENAWSDLIGKKISWYIRNDDNGYPIMYIKQLGNKIYIDRKKKTTSKPKRKLIKKTCSCKKK